MGTWAPQPDDLQEPVPTIQTGSHGRAGSQRSERSSGFNKNTIVSQSQKRGAANTQEPEASWGSFQVLESRAQLAPGSVWPVGPSLQEHSWLLGTGPSRAVSPRALDAGIRQRSTLRRGESVSRGLAQPEPTCRLSLVPRSNQSL